MKIHVFVERFHMISTSLVCFCTIQKSILARRQSSTRVRRIRLCRSTVSPCCSVRPAGTQPRPSNGCVTDDLSHWGTPDSHFLTPAHFRYLVRSYQKSTAINFFIDKFFLRHQCPGNSEETPVIEGAVNINQSISLTCKPSPGRTTLMNMA